MRAVLISTDSEEKEDKAKYERIWARYKKISEEHGAEIKGLHYITRTEIIPIIFENADFSLPTLRNSIKDGETKTNQIRKDIKMS
jgi:NTE family protein